MRTVFKNGPLNGLCTFQDPISGGFWRTRGRKIFHVDIALGKQRSSVKIVGDPALLTKYLVFHSLSPEMYEYLKQWAVKSFANISKGDFNWGPTKWTLLLQWKLFIVESPFH